MGPRRLTFVVTCVAVAVVGAIFAAVGWDTANRFATVAAAFAALGAISAAVWAALPDAPPAIHFYGAASVEVDPSTSGDASAAVPASRH